MTRIEALQLNIDAAQRELDRRAAEGEDVSGLRVCEKTATIVPATKPALVLNPAQAEAVYSAMCALNNVGGRCHVKAEAFEAQERKNGSVLIFSFATDAEGEVTAMAEEVYASQSDFATTYGLSTGADDTRGMATPKDPTDCTSSCGNYVDGPCRHYRPRQQAHDEAECWPDNHGPLSNLPHDA